MHNSLKRDKMLKIVKEKCPTIFPFLYQSYSSSSHLFFKDKLISSEVGLQQGDPLGPALFSLTIILSLTRCSRNLMSGI